MTVASQITDQPYTANGSSTQFSFPNKIFAGADLVVVLTDLVGNLYFFVGGPTTFTNSATGLSYTVSNIDVDTGALVTFSAPPTNGWQVDIRSATPEIQSTSVKNQGQFLPELHEEAFDRATRMIQDLLRLTYTYGIHGQDVETIPWPALPLPALRKGLVLIFDPATGLPTVGQPTTSTVTAVSIGTLITPQTQAEINAGVTPTQIWFQPGDPRRYGAILNGVADDTTALQNWAKVGGFLTFPSLNALVSAAIPLASGTTIFASKGATITTTNPNISILTGTGLANVIVDGLTFVQSGVPATAYVAHVKLVTCTDCRVTNCKSTGACWAGFLLDGCTRCKVDSCYVTGVLGAIADRSDITIHDLNAGHVSSSYCEIVNNWCFGGGANGIMVQDPYNNTAPNHNLVQGNRIGTHTQYGINHYIPGIGNNNVSGNVATGGSVTTLIDTTQSWTVNQFAGQPLTVTIGGVLFFTTITSNTSNTLTFPALGSAVVATDPYTIVGDTFNKILDNWIDGITGAEASYSGTGIYSVGGWAGGLEISRNHVNSCCSASLDRSHAPAGIGIGAPNALYPTAPVISENIITAMSQGDGILVVLLPGGAILEDNEVYIPATNNGTGVGGAGLVGSCIRIEQSPLTVVGPNRCQCLGTGNALFIFATAANMRDIAVSGGYYEAVAGGAVRADQSGGFTVANLIMTGVRGKHTQNVSNGFILSSVNGGVVAGCYGTSGTQPALAISNCTQLRVTGGSYTNGANPAITTSGVCTGSFIDESTYFGTAAAAMSNGGTGGVNVTWRSNASPGAGTWAVGDTTEQNVPVVGNPKRWRCTVAGAPGTWVSEGNL